MTTPRRNRRDSRPEDAGTARFTRKIEDFDCENCGKSVRGNGYTNHCPHCLYSKHVDINPGDRAASCGGLMEPVAAGIERDRHFVVQRCRECGKLLRNKVSPRDDRAVLAQYFGRPIPATPRSPH